MKLLLLGVLFFVNISFAFAENDTPEKTDELKSIISFDTSFTMIALKNNGLGFGLNYEKKITDILSVKLGFGSMIFFPDFIITLDLQFFLYYYPLDNGLDKLYVGVGTGYGSVTYNKKMPNDLFATLTPTIGWKWKMLPYLMVEPFIGWKFLIYERNSYENAEKYLNNGLQCGIDCKLFIKKQ